MATGFNARWGLAIALAVMSAVVAVAAVFFIASPAFTEATESYPRVALTGVVPVLAILAVAAAAQASSRVLKVPWGAVVLGILGSAATAVTYELWYSGVEEGLGSPTPLLIAAGASIVLNGAAISLLIRPILRELPVGAGIAVAVLVVFFGGTIALLSVFPMVSTVLAAAGAVTVVALMRRAERRTSIAASI